DAGLVPGQAQRRLRPLLRRRELPRRGRRRRDGRLREPRARPRSVARAHHQRPRGGGRAATGGPVSADRDGRSAIAAAFDVPDDEPDDGGLYVAVAGNIGAGKSTLTKLLSERYHLSPVFEAVDENPYLEDFYADMS